MKALISEIREMILAARRTAVHSVDLIQVSTNFEIGRRIVEYEQQGFDRAEYGEATLKKLAEALTSEFGKGFSKRNLEYMRRFYMIYRDRRIAQTASAQLEPKMSGAVPINGEYTMCLHGNRSRSEKRRQRLRNSP